VNGDSWLGLVLLLFALLVLVVATAAEAGVVSISRLRVRAFATKPGAASLETYIQERHVLLGTLAVARKVAVVVGIAVGTFLVLRQTGHTWVALAVTMVGALFALVVLEAVPRLVVASSPERWGLRLVPAIGVFRLVFGLPARLLDMATIAAMRGRGAGEPALQAAEDDEELLRLVELHEGNGGGQNGELTMIRRVAGLVDTAVREIMVPRIDMVAVEANDPVDEALRVVVERGFSRIPIYDEAVDHIVGVVYAKDILRGLAGGRRPASLREIARPPYFVPEGKRIDELLAEMRENKVHLAIAVDEYGGTAGLVTIEDVLEEIVGEIQDEYDREEATMQRVNDREAIVDARVSLDDLNELLGLEIESEDVDTVGGFVYHQLGRMPSPGDEIQTDGFVMRVLSVAGRRVKKVRVAKVAEAALKTGAAE
jgi:CBS domain containing-hemolysin-like protein